MECNWRGVWHGVEWCWAVVHCGVPWCTVACILLCVITEESTVAWVCPENTYIVRATSQCGTLTEAMTHNINPAGGGVCVGRGGVTSLTRSTA